LSSALPLKQIMIELEILESEAAKDISAAENSESIEKLRLGFLGKKGKLSLLLGEMKNLSSEERPLIGQRGNVLKTQLQELIKEKLEFLKTQALHQILIKETIDVTAAPSGVPQGHRHPLITTTEQIIDLFLGLGYQVSEGPEIENDYYNFEALNIPPDHPARDMQDTFYLGGEYLLRTHTSPVQIRCLESKKPPVRIVSPGRVYRRDAVDATHSPVFHQVEVLAIDEKLDFSHLRGTVMAFLKAFFGDLPIRFRASYFPFTEPSAEVDVQWRGKWLEVMGCGMVDPAVLEELGIDPE